MCHPRICHHVLFLSCVVLRYCYFPYNLIDLYILYVIHIAFRKYPTKDKSKHHWCQSIVWEANPVSPNNLHTHSLSWLSFSQTHLSLFEGICSGNRCVVQHIYQWEQMEFHIYLFLLCILPFLSKRRHEDRFHRRVGLVASVL